MNEFSPIPRRRPTTQTADGLPRIMWTVEDFESLAEHGFFAHDDRIELIGGELVPMPPKGNRHETVRGELGQWLSRKVPDGIKVYIETGWRADQSHYLEPDIIVFPASANLDALPAAEVLLIIEVSHSSLRYDLDRKSKIYAALGVREYWVVNALTLETRVHRGPSGEAYGAVSDHAKDETLVPELLPALAVNLGALKVE